MENYLTPQTHFFKCDLCGQQVDMRDLGQVFEHEHKDLIIPETTKSKRVIQNAREVYPYCSGEFASGVHSYLHGLPMPTRPCSDDYMQGWMRAEIDLEDNYMLS